MANQVAAAFELPVTSGGSQGLRHPFDPHRRVKAVLFDVDGTLYRQAFLRRMMAIELLTLPLVAPVKASKQLRALAGYRRAQEHLRVNTNGTITSHAQIAAAARDACLPLGEVEDLVERWMFQRPLKYLPYCRAPGVVKLLDLLDRAAVRAGVLTDYPAAQKLRALGLSNRFSLVLCSTDADIGRLKPHPEGFLRACERWHLSPEDVLMVGDRIDVDGAGASAAGMPSVIIGRSRRRMPLPAQCLLVPSFERLYDVLAHRA